MEQAAPLAGWQLPECFAHLRRLLEVGLKKHGSREYVQVLRLLETFASAAVTYAIEEALLLGAISFDAVRHLLLCRIERRPPWLDTRVLELARCEFLGRHEDVCYWATAAQARPTSR